MSRTPGRSYAVCSTRHATTQPFWRSRTSNAGNWSARNRRDAAGDTHLAQPGSPYPAVDKSWIAGRCGGHVLYVCKVYEAGQSCGDRQVDPSLAYDYDAPHTSDPAEP